MSNRTVLPTLPAAERVMRLAQAMRYSSTGRGREIRLACGLGLQDMAAGCGTTKPTIWRWEQGRFRPTGDAAIRWAELLSQLEQSAVTS